MGDLEQLEGLVDNGTPLVFVETADSSRLEDICTRLSTRCARPYFRWSLASGLTRNGGGTLMGPGAQPAQVLQHVLSIREPSLFLLLDLSKFLDDALIVSQLREIALRNRSMQHCLLMAGAALDVPADLRSAAVDFEPALPSLEEIEGLINEEAETWGRKRAKRVQATQAAIKTLARNLAGLSHADARRLIRGAIADGTLSDEDLPTLQDQKYKLLDQGGVLAFELNATKLADVAGLANLKKWLSQRRNVFLAETPLPGLDPPKGLLLLGIQGGGKSLAAKSVAGAWGLPLLRLDFATLYNKYYGETERNLRDALKTSAVMAPCVLWIDEIEKGLASDGEDGGPGKRILGTLLTWMAERKEKVFLVATANDIASLPPELLRKGRFDEIFFVDLPKPETRAAIFEIHLKKRGQDPSKFDLPALATAADGFSGAEIEQAVVSGLYACAADSKPLDNDAIKAACAGTRPLSVVMAEKMLQLRMWAAERTVPAD